MTTTLTRLADQAVQARGGADLFRFSIGDRIPDSAFAKNPDGSVTITGIDFLKAGTFNGLGLVDADLLAMVEHFTALRDAGIFVPPFRLDHSWSVLSVIGYVETLETYRRVDTTDSMEKTFLRGDVRITGNLDHKPADIVDAIKRGHLVNRSSELGYYVTNSGVEIPLAFYGCAYVDIPAVEGLSPVTLSRRPEPHSITNLQQQEGTTMTPEQIARLAELRAMTELSDAERVELAELESAEAADAAAGTEPPAEGGDAPVEVGTTGEPGDTGDQQTGTTPPTGPPAETSATGPVEQPPAAESAELARLRAENAALRSAQADREVARFREAGIIVEGNTAHAEALLRHDSEDVRRAAGALLGSLAPRVELGRTRGRQALAADASASSVGGGAQLITLGMGKDEAGALWASLTTEERAAHREEYDAWIQHRAENGIRD